MNEKIAKLLRKYAKVTNQDYDTLKKEVKTLSKPEKKEKFNLIKKQLK